MHWTARPSLAGVLGSCATVALRLHPLTLRCGMIGGTAARCGGRAGGSLNQAAAQGPAARMLPKSPVHT